MTGVLTPCGGVPGIASVILAVVALRRIRRRPQPGTRFAVSGLIVTGGWLLIIAVTTAVVLTAMALGSPTSVVTAPTPDAAPTPPPAAPSPTPPQSERGPTDATEAERVSVFDLVVGYCIEDLWSDDAGFLMPIVPCDEPHDGQVYAVFDLPDGAWPGAESVEQDAFDDCLDLLVEDFPQVSADEWLDFYYFIPTRFTWSDGDREVVCFTMYLDDKRTGSLFDDGNYPSAVSSNSQGT